MNLQFLDKNNFNVTSMDIGEAFVKQLAEKETPEEIQAIFKEKGIDISHEVLEKLFEKIIKANNQMGVLGTEYLDDIVGGLTIADSSEWEIFSTSRKSIISRPTLTPLKNI